MKRAIPMVLCGLSLAATTWANGQGKGQGTPTPEAESRQVQQLNRQVQALRQTAGLTPLSGPGVVVYLQDKPHKAAHNTPFVPGVVHDYEILEVVNELRAAKAEGIAVNGVRLSNYTSIRCVGPAIYVGAQAISHPYKIEAIGNPDGLQRALSLQGGLIHHLRQAGPSVRLSRATQLRLLAASGAPSFRFGKPE